MKIIAGLCALVMSVTAIAQELKPTKSGLFDVGGFKLYLTCYENDKPTLIIDKVLVVQALMVFGSTM